VRRAEERESTLLGASALVAGRSVGSTAYQTPEVVWNPLGKGVGLTRGVL
jgi:hypothetical protein